MKLTTEQIQIVENTLDLNGLIYDDMKLEVLDHIASEIEAKMRTENIPFEETYKSIFENWKEQLRPTIEFFLFGSDLIGPKMIMKRIAISRTKELKIGLLTTLFITIIVIGCYLVIKDRNFALIIETIIVTTSFLGSILLLGTKFFLNRSKTNTSFKFRFDKGFMFLVLFSLSQSIMSKIFVENNERIFAETLIIAFRLFVISLIINSFRLAYQHFQFEAKYSK